ncbi:MAG: MFS transporter [Eubacteriales bacterium]|nr:MFS transporter [Eubacteriales bacterium]
MKRKRILTLISAVCVQLCVGIIYIWSIFRVPVMEYFGWDSTQASLTFSIMLPLNMLGVLVGGILCDRRGIRPVVLTGAAFAVSGLYLTSLVSSANAALLYVFYAGLCGFGGGLVYASAIASVNQWWTRHKGFAVGLTIGAYGCSTVVFGAWVNRMLSSHLGVQGTFRTLSLIFLLVFAASVWMLRNAPDGVGLARSEAPDQAVVGQKQYTPQKVLATPVYYLLVICLVCLTAPYLMLNTTMKSFAVARGLTAEMAVVTVMTTGIASAAGRIISAWMTDKTSVQTVLIMLFCLALTATGVLFYASGIWFIAAIALVAFAYGGCAAITPLLAISFFGTKYMSSIMGLLIISAIIAGMAHPAIAAKISVDGLPSATTFIVMESIVLGGLILFQILILTQNRTRNR